MSVNVQLTFGSTDKDFDILMKKKNVTEEMLEQGVFQIKNWLKSQPHLCKIEPDLRILKHYLLGKTFNINRAKSKLEHLFICKAIFPEIYSNRNANHPDIIKNFEVVNYCTLSKKMPDNTRIHIFSLNNADPDIFDTTALYKTMFMLCDLRTLYETRSSDCIVIDIKGVTFTHITKILSFSSKVLHITEACYDDQITGYHVLNAPEFATQAIQTVKLLMKKKSQLKIHIHKTLESLYNFIPTEYLPSDYNGTQKSCREITMQWAEALKSQEMTDWFFEQDKYKSDETQRSNNDSLDSNDFAGVHGTFRKLDID